MGALDKIETIAVLGILGVGAYVVWKYGGAILGAIEAPFKALGAGAQAAAGAISAVAGPTAQALSQQPAGQVIAALNAGAAGGTGTQIAAAYTTPTKDPIQAGVQAAELSAVNVATGGTGGPGLTALSMLFNAVLPQLKAYQGTATTPAADQVMVTVQTGGPGTAFPYQSRAPVTVPLAEVQAVQALFPSSSSSGSSTAPAAAAIVSTSEPAAQISNSAPASSYTAAQATANFAAYSVAYKAAHPGAINVPVPSR